MIRSEARSASVTGEPSALPPIFMAARLRLRMAAPARTTRSVSGSISAAALWRSIRGPEERASFIGVPHMQLVFPPELPCVGSTRVRSVSSQQACLIRRVRAFADFQEHLMSGTSSPGPAPDALELAALLCSRVCHDLISPVGAIVNGLEVLADNPTPADRALPPALIPTTAQTPSSRFHSYLL